MTAIRPLSRDFSVSAQVDPADFDELAAAGFRAVISNRPDGEEPGQPSWSQIAVAAKAAGLEARHIPVTPGVYNDEDVARFAAALEEMPGPVLGFCRSGTRAASLWGLSQAGQGDPDAIIEAAAASGCDISGLRQRLAAG
jgi:sulfide:quinone oxidoreductase